MSEVNGEMSVISFWARSSEVSLVSEAIGERSVTWFWVRSSVYQQIFLDRLQKNLWLLQKLVQG